MKFLFTLVAACCAILMSNGAMAAQGRAEGAWLKDYSRSSDLTITHVEVGLADHAVEDAARTRNPQPSNVMITAFTNDPNGPPSPDEHYSFVGGDQAVVNHVVNLMASAGPFPLPVSLAFVWQSCGNGVIFPPVPDLLGTSIDGLTLTVTLPNAGSWYVSVGVDGFDTGDWDWMALARYDGMTPIPVPPAADTDGFGGMTAAPWDLFGINPPGCCLGWERPWCFSVAP